MARPVLTRDRQDFTATRKIENFVPRYGPRVDVVFRTFEEALNWAAEKLGLNTKGAA